MTLPAFAILGSAWAHAGVDYASGRPAFEPWVALCLAVAGAAYAIGVARLWARARAGRGLTRADALAFAGGWLVLALSLAPPLDDWAARSFAAHMLQHELMMLVAAPLLVAGRPLAAFAWAFPRDGRARLATLAHATALRVPWRAATGVLGATLLQLAALGLWHVPAAFDLAAGHRGWHALQHATFLSTALAYWWAVRAAASDTARGGAIASLFATMLATGALGALLTFSTSAWYASALAPPWGGSALDDQQLGGLIMWVPGGVAYLVAALALARELLRGGTEPSLAIGPPR